MAVANLSSERVGTVNVYSMIEHCAKEGFLKNSFLLAFADGHSRSPCN